jgi:hypothetical protein
MEQQGIGHCGIPAEFHRTGFLLNRGRKPGWANRSNGVSGRN